MSNHGRVESLLPCHIIRRAAKIESDKTFLQRQSFAVKNIYVSIFIIIIIAGLSQKQNKRKIVQKKINRNNKLTMKISVASVLAVAAVVPSALAFAPVNMGKTSAVIQQSMTPGPRFESKLFMADDEVRGGEKLCWENERKIWPRQYSALSSNSANLVFFFLLCFEFCFCLSIFFVLHFFIH